MREICLRERAAAAVMHSNQHVIARCSFDKYTRGGFGAPSPSSARRAAAAVGASSLVVSPFTAGCFLTTAYSAPGTSHLSAQHMLAAHKCHVCCLRNCENFHHVQKTASTQQPWEFMKLACICMCYQQQVSVELGFTAFLHLQESHTPGRNSLGLSQLRDELCMA